MNNSDEVAQDLKFARLKYIQMTEGLGFYPTEEQEQNFDFILTDEQLEIRYNNAKQWYKTNYGRPKLLRRFIYRNSGELDRVKIMLNKQGFESDMTQKIINILKEQ